jgi:hypothetical protein
MFVIRERLYAHPVEHLHELRRIVAAERHHFRDYAVTMELQYQSVSLSTFTTHIMGYMWCREPDGSVRQGHCQGSCQECGVR